MTLLDWAEHHVLVFGLRDRQVDTVASWLPLFQAAGYSPEMLTEVTDWLALNSPPKFYDGEAHLNAIRTRLRELLTIQANTPQDDTYSVCTLCGNSGRIVVPHPKCIKDGHWRPYSVAGCTGMFYTSAVRCHCTKGRLGTFGKMWTLEQYESINPNWRQQMKDKDKADLEAARLSVGNGQT